MAPELGVIATAWQWFRLLFPPLCPGCGQEVAEAGRICPRCLANCPLVAVPGCPLCGVPLAGQRAPPLEGAASGPGAPPAVPCDACLAARPPWQAGRCAGLHAGLWRRAVLAWKHGGRIDLLPWLADRLAARLAEIVPPDAILVPVPMGHLRRIRRRGNPAADLARALGARLERPVVVDLLQRTRQPPPQEGRGAAERRGAQIGSMAVRPRHAARAAGASLVVIDDVLTTGATLAEA
ncbi:MAG: ComF family protein, partial [Alphaproteobacteria bacterium]